MCRPLLGLPPKRLLCFFFWFFYFVLVWLLWHRSRPINKAWRPAAVVSPNSPRFKDSKDTRKDFPFRREFPPHNALTAVVGPNKCQSNQLVSWLLPFLLPPCKKSKSSLAECVAALNSCSQHTKNTADPQTPWVTLRTPPIPLDPSEPPSLL